MPLHALTEITLGVPNVNEIVDFYTTFGLTPLGSSAGQDDQWFATVDGGRQLRVVEAPIRRLVTMTVGADDPDDLRRVAASLERIGAPARVDGGELITREPVSGLEVRIAVADRITVSSTPVPAYNAPGSLARSNVRASALLRPDPVRPRRLGHVALGSSDILATQQFFAEGLGFKISDEVRERAAFMRCSTDHHNVMLQAAPVAFLHHTSWEVDDVDEIGRGAQAVLEDHPERHTFGLGRHWIGSNFFYYLRDPAGNLSEYYSDMDAIVDDQLWQPGVIEPGSIPANAWGPPLPPSMIRPDDLAELMAGLH